MLSLPFVFERPSTIDKALAAIGEDGEGMFYSGGTELLLAMKMRVIHTERLVDIKGIAGLDDIALNAANEIEVGARCTHKKIEGNKLIREYVPALSALCADVGNIRVRSVGTIGGNLCFGEPHADPPTMLAALDARLMLLGPSGMRIVNADDFIQGELETVRAPDELLTMIVFPRPSGSVTYRRFKQGERPSVNVAMVCSLGERGTIIEKARIRVGALSFRPQAMTAVEDVLRGLPLADARGAIVAALPGALDALDVNEDRHGSADYKRHLAGVLLRRNLDDALTGSRSHVK